MESTQKIKPPSSVFYAVPIILLVIGMASILCACTPGNGTSTDGAGLNDETAGAGGEEGLDNDDSALDDEGAGMKEEDGMKDAAGIKDDAGMKDDVNLENMVYMISDRDTYNIDEDMIGYSIYNQTGNIIAFGYLADVEIQSETGWETVPYKEDVVPPLEFLNVAPGETMHLILYMSNLTQHTTGKYRITKEIFIEDKAELLSIEFEIK